MIPNEALQPVLAGLIVSFLLELLKVLFGKLGLTQQYFDTIQPKMKKYLLQLVVFGFSAIGALVVALAEKYNFKEYIEQLIYIIATATTGYQLVVKNAKRVSSTTKGGEIKSIPIKKEK